MANNGPTQNPERVYSAPTYEMYLGLASSPSEENVPLPKVMPQTELDVLLASSYTELLCLSRGPMNPVDKKSPGQIHDDLGEAGAFAIEVPHRGNFKNTLMDFPAGFFTDPIIEGASLTPFGNTARSFGGLLLEDISLTHCLPIKDILGEPWAQASTKPVSTSSGGQFKRLLTISTIARSGVDGIDISDLRDKAAEREIGRGMLKHHLGGLVDSQLVVVEYAARRRRRFIPSPVLVEVEPRLTDIIQGVRSRDPDLLKSGDEALDSLMARPTILPYLMQRSRDKLKLDENNRSVPFVVEEMAVKAIELNNGEPIKTHDMYELSGYSGSYSAFRAALRQRLQMPPPSRIERLGDSHVRGRSGKWVLKPEKKFGS